MKRVWKQKEGVSPVIATILMVAITVVLAAVLYVMVSGYMLGGSTLVSGGLTYLQEKSNPSGGNATFTLVLTTPQNPKVSDVSITVLDAYGNIVTTNVWTNWTHIASKDDTTRIKTGDRLMLTVGPGTNIRGYEVRVSIAGYSGEFGENIPA